MADETVRVVAHFAVKPEAIEAFKRAALELLVAPTQGESGCVLYELCQDASDPTRFAMVEEWESRAALDAHLAQESLRTAIGKLAPMAAEPPATHFLRPVRVSD